MLKSTTHLKYSRTHLPLNEVFKSQSQNSVFVKECMHANASVKSNSQDQRLTNVEHPGTIIWRWPFPFHDNPWALCQTWSACCSFVVFCTLVAASWSLKHVVHHSAGEGRGCNGNGKAKEWLRAATFYSRSWKKETPEGKEARQRKKHLSGWVQMQAAAKALDMLHVSVINLQWCALHQPAGVPCKLSTLKTVAFYPEDTVQHQGKQVYFIHIFTFSQSE